MALRIALTAALATVIAVGCASPTEQEDAADQTGALQGQGMRTVSITVSATKTGQNYEARAYPISDTNGDGKIELFNAPIYEIYVDGTDDSGRAVRKTWSAPRFMPYNNPGGIDTDYHTPGFFTAGLSSVPKKVVTQYKPNYEVHNSFSPYGGAIVVQGSFYIHAGPESITDWGWGSAGCVEVFGNFDDFKKDILTLAGSPAAGGDAAALHRGMSSLVAAGKLTVAYEAAQKPNITAHVSRQYNEGEQGQGNADADSTADVTVPDGQ